MQEKQQVVFIHGGDVFPSHEAYVEHLKTKTIDIERLRQHTSWSATLTTALGESFDVLAPRMPLSNNAPYTLWKLWFERCSEVFDNSIVLVGHSLGGILLTKYLSENTAPFSIRNLLIVAAPFDTDNDGQLPEEWQLPTTLERVTAQSSTTHLFHSTDDPVVPYDNAKRYKRALAGAQLHTFTDRGHFLQPTFPELVQTITEM